MPDDTQGQPYMLIRELKRHFPARLPEWANSFTMFAWGAYILMHPGIFATSDLYEAFVSMVWIDAVGETRIALAERSWGLITVTVGLIRACALFVNGSYSRTPAIRLVCSAMSAFVWSQVVIGLLRMGIPSTGIVMYSSALALDLISAYRATCDAVIASEQQRSVRAKRRGKSDSYGPVGMAHS